MINDQNKKKIGLIIADPNEIHNLNEFIYIKTFEHKNFKVDLYECNNNYIYVINSLIGIVNASMVCQYLIDNYLVHEIWNYGAVGATQNLNINNVIIPYKFFYFDVKTPWYQLGQVPNEKEYYINSFEQHDNINIASGHSFINDIEEVKDLKNKLNVDLFDMESCAIAQVCFKNNIPFYCVKGVSDIIGENKLNKKDINLRISQASKKALDKLIKLLLIK